MLAAPFFAKFGQKYENEYLENVKELCMAKQRKQQLKKARKRGESPYEDLRGPNAWNKIVGQEAPGARLKYSPAWHSKYNTGGR